MRAKQMRRPEGRIAMARLSGNGRKGYAAREEVRRVRVAGFRVASLYRGFLERQ